MPTFLLEVGTEELPADFVASAIAQWQTLVPHSLEENFLVPEKIEVFGTPRRLSVLLSELPARQDDRREEVKGPPATAAFKDGKPTRAAEGFARKQGVEVEALEVRATEKGEFVFALKETPGRAAMEILPDLILEWIGGLEGRRFMRWGDGDWRFPRPIRWLVALLDEDVVPVEWVNGSERRSSDRVSRGHRVLHPEPVTIPQAADYRETLTAAGVEVDPEARRGAIAAQIAAAAKEAGGSAEVYPDLLEEVVNLVEWPTAVVGKFDREFLNLPAEAIATVMVTHQRYFPIKETAAQNSLLLPNFIAISNGDPAKSEIITAGNERVIRARLADARFFYDADCSEPLETYLPQLETVTFQEDLGTIHDKVERIIEIAEEIGKQLELSPQKREWVERAALLCKVDLVSQMVYEFPELQGVMGQKYAIASGEPVEVADAIFEHYLPRGADDVMPESAIGQIVGIADRLDTLISIFGLGMLPTGSSDPFALRRAANAVISIIWHANLAIDLDELLEQFCRDFVSNHPERESPYAALQEFFIQRLRTLLQEDKNIDYDLVNAVLGENDEEYRDRALSDLLDARDRALFLQQIRHDKTLEKIYETVNRSTRLAVKGDLATTPLEPEEIIDRDRFEKNSEREFYNALVQLVPKTQAARAERNYQLLVDNLVQIAPIVANFFDGEDSVLVMAEDVAVQRNRLNLLGLLRNHARVLSDFGRIVK